MHTFWIRFFAFCWFDLTSCPWLEGDLSRQGKAAKVHHWTQLLWRLGKSSSNSQAKFECFHARMEESPDFEPHWRHVARQSWSFHTLTLWLDESTRKKWSKLFEHVEHTWESTSSLIFLANYFQIASQIRTSALSNGYHWVAWAAANTSADSCTTRTGTSRPKCASTSWKWGHVFKIPSSVTFVIIYILECKSTKFM